MPQEYFVRRKSGDGRIRETDPTEDMVEAYILAQKYYESGCPEVKLVLSKDGDEAEIPFVDIERFSMC